MWEKLLEVIGDNAEARALVEKLQGSTNENVKKINDLETKFNEAKTGRDTLKNLIRQSTGLEEVTEETINEFVTGLKGAKSGDEKLTLEIKSLKGLLEEANNEKSKVVGDYESKLSDMALTNQIRDLGIGSKSVSPIAEKMILDHLKSGASLDGDKIIYKNEDGTTMYDGTNVVTPESRFNSLMSDENWKPLLKADIAGGSGTTESSGGSQGDKPKTFKERFEAHTNK